MDEEKLSTFFPRYAVWRSSQSQISMLRFRAYGIWGDLLALQAPFSISCRLWLMFKPRHVLTFIGSWGTRLALWSLPDVGWRAGASLGCWTSRVQLCVLVAAVSPCVPSLSRIRSIGYSVPLLPCTVLPVGNVLWVCLVSWGWGAAAQVWVCLLMMGRGCSSVFSQCFWGSALVLVAKCWSGPWAGLFVAEYRVKATCSPAALRLTRSLSYICRGFRHYLPCPNGRQSEGR